MATLATAPMHEKEAAILEILAKDDNTPEAVDDAADEAAEMTTSGTQALDENDIDDIERLIRNAGDPNAGDPDQSNDDDPVDEEDDDPVYTVKVRGEERQVKLRELQNGYSRTEDYKAKTAEVAEMRRAVNAEQKANAEKMNAVLQTAVQLDPILMEASQINWHALAATNPQAFAIKKAAYEQRIGQISHISQARDQMNLAQLQAHAQQEEQALVTARPDWADPKIAALALSDLRENLMSRYGFNREDVQNIPNHKFVLVADDARKYHELLAQQGRVKAKKTTASPSKSMKASRKSGVSKSDAAMKAKAKSGSLDDKAAYILSKL